MSATSELQRRLNVVRRNRHSSAFGPIEESGVMDRETGDALRAFQHEHNLFVGEKVLAERGQLDTDTELALEWWIEVLGVEV